MQDRKETGRDDIFVPLHLSVLFIYPLNTAVVRKLLLFVETWKSPHIDL